MVNNGSKFGVRDQVDLWVEVGQGGFFGVTLNSKTLDKGIPKLEKRRGGFIALTSKL